MPRTPSFKVKETSKGWLFHVPASISDTGKLQRRYFPTRDAAVKEAKKIRGEYRANGEQASVLPPRVADDAVAALRLLEGTGANLLAAAQAFREAWDARNASALFGEAVAQYLDSRADLRESTLKSYRYTLERTFLPLHDRTLADITTADFAAILEGKGATAARMHRANVSGFWRWASKPPRSWCKFDCVQALEIRRASKDADIQILKPAEVRALLAAAEVEGHAAAVAYAIAVFGGVRMAELERLTWGAVSDDHIEIGRDIAKKHSRRLVPACPTLTAWLKAHRNDSKNDEAIVPSNWTDVSKSVRRRAGWAVKARLLKNAPEPTRGMWPANACRHTCASVQIASGASLEDLTFKFGHAGGHDVLRAHYVSRLTKKDALAILAIGPNGKELPIITAA